MAKYAIAIARPATKEIERLPNSVLQRARSKIDQFITNPRPPGCKKLQASRNRWRVRVGDYRIIYAINDERLEVDVVAVRHRRFVYD